MNGNRVAVAGLVPLFLLVTLGGRQSRSATRSMRRNSACIAALRPMIPWKEGRSAPAIRAQLPPRRCLYRRTEKRPAARGHPVGLDAGRYGVS